MVELIKIKDIFTPGRFPIWTYVDDHLKTKEQQLHDALDDGSMLVSISGPSKSGKTVFVEHTLGKENLVQVTGSGVRSPSDLWIRVFDIIGTPLSRSTSSGNTVTGTIGAKGSVEGSILVAKGKGEVSGSGSYASQKSESQVDAIDYLQLLIRELSAPTLLFLSMIFTTFIEKFSLN
jgi:hypothetical protein